MSNVAKAYTAEFPAAWEARAGERLRFERRPTAWPGWLWCTAADGTGRWVPERWVACEGDTCVLVRDYSAVELSVQAGDRLAVELVESGWAWATAEDGRRGWVPLECLAPQRTPAVSLSEAAALLGPGVTRENVRSRIRRGTLQAHQAEGEEWRVPLAELERILSEAGACGHCDRPASSLVIVKYHHHERVEFVLCGDCAAEAEAAYGRQQGVLEVSAWPLHGEGWIRS